MRNYTVLSVGERIPISVAGERYYLDVLETRPAHRIRCVNPWTLSSTGRVEHDLYATTFAASWAISIWRRTLNQPWWL